LALIHITGAFAICKKMCDERLLIRNTFFEDTLFAVDMGQKALHGVGILLIWNQGSFLFFPLSLSRLFFFLFVKLRSHHYGFFSNLRWS
jgi:hypothetical protein